MAGDLQSTWDSCLLIAWRKSLNVGQLFNYFESVTKQRAEDLDLLRKPKQGFPYKIGVRKFVADYLEKISNRMFEQPPEKDILLLRKLKTSCYTTTQDSTLVKEKDRVNAIKQTKRNEMKIQLDSHNYGNRNHKTDWKVVK